MRPFFKGMLYGLLLAYTYCFYAVVRLIIITQYFEVSVEFFRLIVWPVIKPALLATAVCILAGICYAVIYLDR